MKERVLAFLKPAMQPKGFKADELESIADLIARNLKAESTDEEIKANVDAFIPMADLMQRVGNRYATGVETKYRGYKSQEEIDKLIATAIEEANKKKTNTPPAPPTPPADPQGGITDFLSKLQTQQAEYQAMLQKSIAEQIANGVANALKPINERNEKIRLAELLNSHPKVKAIPETFRRGYRLEKDEDLDNVVLQMETDYAALKQEQLRSGEFATPPAAGNPQKQEEETIAFLNAMGTPNK